MARFLPLTTACLTLALTASMMVSARAWPGTVGRVVDGDTVVILTDAKEQIKVRLYGIDCPERRQEFGGRATETARKLTALNPVDVEPVETDRYGRLVVIVTLPSGVSLQECLLTAGMAWVYPPYCRRPECREWKALETTARTTSVGLWADPASTPPWTWRKERKEKRQ